jgi:hypothetical protein
MAFSLNAEVRFLLAFPDNGDGIADAPAPINVFKDAPYFQPVDIRVWNISKTEHA